MDKRVEQGLVWLDEVSVTSEEIIAYKNSLLLLVEALSAGQDLFAWLSVIQSLKALSKNTFGVGALIVDEENNIVTEGHNQVFYPYFRGDLHAEMVVLNQLENMRKSNEPPVNYTLYTSMEPCMMCLARCISSRIGRVYFVARDYHGAVLPYHHLPSVFANLMETQTIQEIECHPSLKKISTKILASSAQELTERVGGTIDVMKDVRY